MLHNKIIVLLAFSLSLCAFAAAEESYEMTKDLSESFKVEANSKVEIENKYGDIFIETWDKDSVSFEIEIVAFSEKEEHLEDLIDRVEVEFKGYSTFIIVKTLIGEDRNIFDKAAFKFNKSISGTREVRINYVVRIPEYVSLSIENEFGDVFVDEYSGKFDMDLSHGDFRANSLTDVQSLKFRYGEVKLNRAVGGRCDFGFVKGAQLGVLEDIFIKSSSSELDIEEIDVLRIESRLDQIYVDNVNEISGKTNMSKVHIKYLNSTADLESRYGNVRVDNLMPTASEVKMNGTNTDYMFNFSSELQGEFEVQMSNSKTFKSNKERVTVMDEVALDDKTNIYEGSINGSDGDLKILVYTKNGDVSFGR